MVILDSVSAFDVRARGAIKATRRAVSKSAVALPGFIALCDQGAVSITNFATAVMIGRVCGKAELGVYSLAWTLITITTGIIATLNSAPYTVFGPQLERSVRRLYLGSILVHQSLLSTLFASLILSVAALGRWQGWLSISTSNVGTTTAAVIVFISLKEFIRSVSFAELRVDWALSVDLTACLAQIAGIALLVHWGALTASRTYTILGISSAVAACGWLALHRQTFHFDKRFYIPDLKRNWDFGKWVLGSGLLWQATAYLFPWVLAAFHGRSVTGVWAACSAIVALGNPVLMGLSNYLLPKISNIYATSGVQKMKRHVHRYSLLFIVLLLPVVIAMAGFGERLLTGIYGAGYGGTRGTLILLALTLLVTTQSRPYSQGLFSLGCAKTDTLVNVVWVVLMIAVGIPAVRSYAAFGAAATMAATSSMAAAIRMAAFARETRRRLTRGGAVPLNFGMASPPVAARLSGISDRSN
jgi:O-antigen/teichoic acid export membrane protein